MREFASKNGAREVDYAAPVVFRWRLYGEARPFLTAAYRVGMATRAAVYAAAEARGLMPLPEGFHKSPDHSHAFWLPEDSDGDGAIDHVILFAARGIPWDLLPLLTGRLVLRLADLGSWQLLPESMGGTLAGSLFGPARRWRSLTAYVPPGKSEKRTGKNQTPALSPQERLRWEIGCRKLGVRARSIGRLPAVIRGEVALPSESFTLRARRLKRLPRATTAPNYWHAPRGAEATAFALTFNRPVIGPLAFGFGCHFGLGLFAPSEETPQVMDDTREDLHGFAIC